MLETLDLEWIAINIKRSARERMCDITVCVYRSFSFNFPWCKFLYFFPGLQHRHCHHNKNLYVFFFLPVQRKGTSLLWRSRVTGCRPIGNSSFMCRHNYVNAIARLTEPKSIFTARNMNIKACALNSLVRNEIVRRGREKIVVFTSRTRKRFSSMLHGRKSFNFASVQH